MGTAGEGLKLDGLVSRVLIGRSPKRTLIRMAIWVVAIVLISKYIILPIRVEGISMLPTYRQNQVAFVNCLAYKFTPPKRGDVVAIRLAGRHVMYCKRIIALPGETIAFHEGRVLINGQVLEEPYLKQPCNWERAPEIVGPDEYYVVGDNRTMDFEQHTQGRAEVNRIVGKLFL
ncbi:MAG TPA: signal peptidase I [Clostridia bacterium]|nr:signal peptidase I [Clostridia bacterium]